MSGLTMAKRLEQKKKEKIKQKGQIVSEWQHVRYYSPFVNENCAGGQTDLTLRLLFT